MQAQPWGGTDGSDGDRPAFQHQETVDQAGSGHAGTDSSLKDGAERRTDQAMSEQERQGTACDAGADVSTDEGKVELGIESFVSGSSSQGMRALWEERRVRAQRRDRVIRRIWYAAVLLFLLITLALVGWSLWHAPTPARFDSGPPTDVETPRPPKISPRH